MGRRWLATAIGVAWTMLAVDASAADGLDLVWNAPVGCPSRDAVLEDVAAARGKTRERRAGVDVVGASAAGAGLDARAAIDARVDVVHLDDGRWRASVSLGQGASHSTRTFDAESCPAAARASALIVAVAVDAMPPSSPPPVPARRADTPSAPPPVRARTKPAGASQMEVGLAGSIDGMLPAAAPGGEVSAAWVFRRGALRVRAGLALDVFAPQRAFGSRPGEAATFWLVGGAARACASLVVRRIEVGPCLGGELDDMWASSVTGPGPFAATPRAAPYATLLGSLLAAVDVGRRGRVFVRADAEVPLARPSFVLDRPSSTTELHLVPQVALRAAMGIGWSFF